MGCDASSVPASAPAPVTGPPISPFSAKSPSVDSLTQQSKRSLRKIIQKDELHELAVTMAEIASPMNIQISQTGHKWMLTHLSCRYDASSCLQYLLKNYFVQHAISYLDFVNAQTFEGYTCLHLCAMWKAQKCFQVLLRFGGISLNLIDKNNKVPYELAVQNKCKKIVETLAFLKDQMISLVALDADKLLSGDVISENINKNKENVDFKIEKKTDKMIKIQQTQLQKQLKSDKNKLQEQLIKLHEQKLKKQKSYQKQKQENDKKTQKMKFDQRQKLQKQLQEKIEKAIKLERQKYKADLDKSQAQLHRVKEELKKINDKKQQQAIQKAQQKAEQIVKQKQQTIKQKQKDKEAIMDKIKAKTSSVQQNPEQKEQQKKQNGPTDIQEAVNALKQAFKAYEDECPPETQQLYRKALSQGQFVDQQFPASMDSIGNDPSNQKYQHYSQSIVWLRPHEFMEGQQQIQVFNGIDANDIQQGELGVCYMLATLASMSATPSNIQNLFVYTDTNVGFYVLRLFIHGKITYFTIDDLIPCDSNTNSPCFCRPVGNQLWVILLQKCWAKAIGTYLSAEGMAPNDMMEDLSGAPAFGAALQDNPQRKISVLDHIKQLIKHCKMGNTIVLASHDNQPQGMVANHAYTLLQCYQVDKKVIFKIRNPWGNTQWAGQYGQKSKSLTPAIKKLIGYTNEDDGIFYLSDAQLIQFFAYYSVNYNFVDYCYTYEQFTSKVGEDKFYKFSLTKKAAANVRITQMFDRMLQDQNYSYSTMIFQIGKIQGNKVKFIGQGDDDSVVGAKTIHAFQNICTELDAGDYFVRVRMFWPNQQNYSTAVISVYAPQFVTLQQIQQKKGQQYLKSMLLSHAANVEKQPTDDGGFIKFDMMKGQALFVAQPQKNGNYICTIQFSQDMMGMQPDINKAGPLTLKIPTSKNNPGLGTLTVDALAQQSYTGEMNVIFSPA